jgi:hypothetical protein
MQTNSTSAKPSSFQEWTNFMSDLSNNKNSSKPFLVKAEDSQQIINNLEKELLKPDLNETVKLILIKKQLSFNFPIAA